MFLSTIRVLLVDDLESIRTVVKAYLHRLGVKHVDEAQDGAEGYTTFLREISNDPYGLIISDWNMPKMSGLEFLAKVRTFEGNESKTPFVIMTTESEKEKVFEAIQAGVNNYIVKPVQEDVLREKLDGVFKKLRA